MKNLPLLTALSALLTLAAAPALAEEGGETGTGDSTGTPAPSPEPAPQPAPQPEPQPEPSPPPEPTTEAPETAAEKECDTCEPPERRVSFSLYGTLAANYIFRGYALEAHGPLFQPGAAFSLSLVQLEKGLTDLSLSVGLWNSLHRPGGTTGQNLHYELDFSAGLSATFADMVNTSVTWALYTSPRGEWTATQELLAHLDVALAPTESLSLTPGVNFVAELVGQADGGAAKGLYIEPNFALDIVLPIPNWEPSITIPLAVGLSLSNYYEGANGDAPFGFFSARATANLPLSFIPEKFGAWTVSAGGGVILLGPTPAEVYEGPVAPIADLTINVDI